MDDMIDSQVREQLEQTDALRNKQVEITETVSSRVHRTKYKDPRMALV